MARPQSTKAAAPKAAPAPAPKPDVTSLSHEELLAKVAALEEKVREGEDGALKRVSKALGVDSDEVLAKEAEAPVEEDMVQYDLGPLGKEVIQVNGQVVPRRGVARRSEVETYASMAGNLRMRKLREQIEERHLIEAVAGGGFSSRLLPNSEELA